MALKLCNPTYEFIIDTLSESRNSNSITDIIGTRLTCFFFSFDDIKLIHCLLVSLIITHICYFIIILLLWYFIKWLNYTPAMRLMVVKIDKI